MRGRYEALVPEIFRPVPRPRQHSEAIVIGSGFGGAVSALRLAEAGIQTTVLERGSRWPHSPRREIFGMDGRMLWHAQRSLAQSAAVGRSTLTVPSYAESLGAMAAVDDFGGIFEVTWHRNSAIMCGAAVGGGSVIYIGITAQSLRTPFDAVFRGVVDFDEMERIWYPKALAGLGATVVPADVYRHSSFDNARDFDRVSRRAGYRTYPVPGNWRWQVVRDEIAGRAKPMATTSALANSNGSLNSLTYTYLPRAEATGRATIHPRHQVNDIHVEKSGRFVLDVDYLSPYGDVLDNRRLTTDRLIVAAGCLGTSRLLVKARDTGTLPNLNEHIGSGWGNNGNGNIDVALGGTRKKEQSAVGARGFFDTDGTVARAVVNSTFELGPLNNVAAAANTSAIKMGITSVDDTRGTFRYRRDSGQVILDWPANGNADVAANCVRIGQRLADHAGLPVDAVLYEPDMTWTHGLGGAPLGTACDAYGRVHGYRNLYVNDGAMVPGSAGASNPSLTITAVAERNIARIIADGR
ncbi:GMC oxidoreductase [Gordonia sinesedis]